MLTNENNWTPPEPIPEPIPKPTLKKMGVLFFSPEDMQEAKISMKEKGIKVFLSSHKVIKFIQALASKLRDFNFIISIERIYLYYLCRVIKTMYFFNRW